MTRPPIRREDDVDVVVRRSIGAARVLAARPDDVGRSAIRRRAASAGDQAQGRRGACAEARREAPRPDLYVLELGTSLEPGSSSSARTWFELIVCANLVRALPLEPGSSSPKIGTGPRSGPVCSTYPRALVHPRGRGRLRNGLLRAGAVSFHVVRPPPAIAGARRIGPHWKCSGSRRRAIVMGTAARLEAHSSRCPNGHCVCSRRPEPAAS